MSQAQATAPVIRRAATAPPVRHKLFVNIPVRELQRSIDFFEALGFAFNTQFTDANATCMLVGEDAYFMLLTHDFFRGFSERALPDLATQTGALYALSVESRAAVDTMVQKALAHGGSAAGAPKDHGFMYQSSFRDPDGHHWEVFWMDPANVQG